MLANSKAFSGFSVPDVTEAQKFYGETLGLETEVNNGILFLNLAGGHKVLVYPKSDHQPATFTVLNFPVDDIEASVDALFDRGIKFERYEGTEIETDEKGIFRGEGPLIAWFTDPAGNVLSVIQDS